MAELRSPALVGVIGRKRSGKDTFAARLVAAHGYTRIAFADPLRAAALALDPIVSSGERCAGEPDERLSEVVARLGWEAAKDVYEVRRTLQNFGVGLRDTLGPDIWVDYAMRHVDREPGPVVITDVRFPNEADAVEARGGMLVRIIRPGLGSDDDHISETALDARQAHHMIINAGTVADLHVAADSLAARLPRVMT